MKKLFCCLLAAVLMLSLFGCGAKAPAAQGGIEGTPEEIIAKIYETHETIDLSLVGMDLDLTDADAVAYYTGLASGEKLSAASVSETMLGQPYSLVVARVKNAADASQVGKEMFEKIDGRKWICVAADTRTAAVCGDVVMFFMISSEYEDAATAQSMLEAFRTACGGNITVIG